jgi:hypothetical protein
MNDQPTALRLADELKERKATHRTYSGTGKVTLVTGNSADPLCRDAAAELRRLHSVNTELGAALRRLISYCNNLENRLLEADGEHPAMQEAKEAYAKVEGKV